MISLVAQMRILVAVAPVDFRKGIDGLVRICKEALEADAFSFTAGPEVKRVIAPKALDTANCGTCVRTGRRQEPRARSSPPHCDANDFTCSSWWFV
jgi:hypothetical protein